VDRLSVQRERARITRDLHDIVSHHLALIVIQAAAGRLAEPWQGEVAAGRSAPANPATPGRKAVNAHRERQGGHSPCAYLDALAGTG
jgi:signal transduction histidine kinase